jgi:hypothetical protein
MMVSIFRIRELMYYQLNDFRYLIADMLSSNILFSYRTCRLQSEFFRDIFTPHKHSVITKGVNVSRLSQ